MEINGIAHIILTVSRFDDCVTFYRRLLPFLGLRRIIHDRNDYFYCIGGRTGFGIRARPTSIARSIATRRVRDFTTYAFAHARAMMWMRSGD